MKSTTIIFALLAIFAVANADIVFLDNADTSATEASTSTASSSANKCPKIECGSTNKDKLKECEVSKGKQSTKDRVITITGCAEKESCPLNADFAGETDIKAVCVADTEAEKVKDRYPGETCETDDNCAAFEKDATKGKCVDKKCAGSAIDAKCEQEYSCIPTAYCEGRTEADDQGKKTVTAGTCKAAVALDKECKGHHECADGNICLTVTVGDAEKNLCKKLFSLANKETIKVVQSPKSQTLVQAADACVSGFSITVPATEEKPERVECGEQKYAASHAADTIDEGFAKCQFDEDCKYSLVGTATTEKTEKCLCGGATEQGYCPYAKNANAEKNTKITGLKTAIFKASGSPYRRSFIDSNTTGSKGGACVSAYENNMYFRAKGCLVSEFKECEEFTVASGNFVGMSMILLGFLAMMF